ncbi:GTP cyclohydrolase II-domain-containing protein [Irpex rosettiformis]|uniref:GTP cyclohydrolase II-domain-containing protein n=1 Tax=Irpex rosettiformis TaxID=378272 RepID=A0ACB8UD18_9APHY|nr:GTP cyclohydrolase II-domain-containing protein [Irpex rosettiformis]
MPFHHDVDSLSAGMSDLALLDFLTSPDLPVAKHGIKRRDAELDPLMLAAVYSSGPQVTRNHYAHDFFPAVGDPQAEGAYDWTKWQPENSKTVDSQRRPRLKYVSRQEPRSQRLRKQGLEVAHEKVRCMARTRVPTPHGPVFLHLYHNNRDNKEHLAIVVDPAQFEANSPNHAPAIRSRSLDAVWNENETEMDRITRGAYVGRLSSTSQHASSPSPPSSQSHPPTRSLPNNIPSPLIRLHSECFTGETIGSMRCDCGEQLDEAIRQISQPITLPALSPSSLTPTTTIPGRGAVIYLRQEGRGIGLLSKIRAYNLQDMGHDTVTANLMLGHKADERGYEVAAAILRDLGLGGKEGGESVRVLTNNPDKMDALKKEGIRVVERVPMVPRSWQCRQHDVVGNEQGEGKSGEARKAGATMIGGGSVYGEDLDKYLRTKVLRMGHMLPLVGGSEENDL